MLEIISIAVCIILVMDLSMWRYGRDLLRIDNASHQKIDYGPFLFKRLPIIIAVFASFMFVMMDSYKSIYLRVALLVVMLLGYVVITLKELRGHYTN